MEKKDEFEKHACEFKNEDECEEELDEEDEKLEEVEEDHFEDEGEKKNNEN